MRRFFPELLFLFVVVTCQGGIEIQLSPRTLTDTIVGADYSQKFTASGGTRPYNFELVGAGQIPPGLAFAKISDTEALLQGVPQQAGTYTFNIRVTDNQQKSAIFGYALRVLNDTQAPQFSGLQNATATSASTIDLTWPPAQDNVTPQNKIVYLICQSQTAGQCVTNFSATYTTQEGATSYRVTNLNSATTYYFVVRAKDRAGNTDGNTVEKSATTQ
ncbi:MAG: putative Ig domain-containing protein [bacterium JZ-2024 1]